MAFHLSTSVMYTQRYGIFYTQLNAVNNANVPDKWKNANMDVTAMLSVNEVVLDESCFVTSQPCLVVNDVEKVQTRYLIVKGVKHEAMEECKIDVPECLKNVTYHSPPNQYRIFGYYSSLSHNYNHLDGRQLNIPKDQ